MSGGSQPLWHSEPYGLGLEMACVVGADGTKPGDSQKLVTVL
ncbi:hypothetical protein [Streptomyces roseochromogenus]|uniref:Uncharacterized protein n=1 Tax=Streptomyces roseochromogenus subsp. oscitans DS 12.976 TaxID=1352936 RepID=V6KW80_STRRC|nr:hypothetical protein [Streptomyces roseochromogenus]EST36397.1 hypothetical protein M878_02110 [Streptomyces roseochromogenus subsp. oscitans DS 12.976]